ncbi:LysR family transcriptional regulator [Aestuariicoccus sp. MJ-SS9]|uniref:LysR family transcriptional regulator n=1 Tax=Aestuariicoccus sp. MJ-SS9 TaxID=3079855 RepID=UPI0029105824|nr:LysR family transcriptional regulator [Aestuariicoccus sp. MJ-SS9]MDU8909753.1 LysR family transcriptional regulator [Aestuariicoccus sp. MJ-SS9]
MTQAGRSFNLRHLRAFVEVCDRGSISEAAGVVHLSQPAITHAIARLEDQLRTRLFHRAPRGMVPTAEGERFRFRASRALDLLNGRAGRARKPMPLRVETRATAAQLGTLIAIGETGSYSAAARALGAAQPTVYRAARDLEDGLGLPLFEKAGSAVRLSRQGEALQQAARLMFAELEQATEEIATALGHGAARVRIGALPLARATILSEAIDSVQDGATQLRIYVDDGPFPELLQAVRTGALDILVGALRDPPPARDIRQETLFLDRLAIFCGPDHPLMQRGAITPGDLHSFPWVLPRSGTPTRSYFERAFPSLAEAVGETLVETSSMVLVRQLLQSRHRLTLISRAQVVSETRRGLLFELPVALDDAPRAIGALYRADWYPTSGQAIFLQALRDAGRRM